MAILSVSQILTLITNFVKAKNPQVDIQPGTDLYDLLFETNAQTVRVLFEAIQTLQNNQSITTTTGKDLDLIAKNYNVTRRPATYATGQVTFFTTSFANDIFIPINTIVSTAGTNVTPPIRFLTTQSAGMSVANKAIYFDSTALRYSVNANVIAEVAGISNNVDALIVTQLVTSITGIQGVSNVNPITGGTDQETDVSMQQRCLISFVSSSIGTLYGYSKLLTDNFPQVLAVNAIGPFDAGAIRTDGVDVLALLTSTSVAGNNLQVTEAFTFHTGDPGYTPLNRPVVSVDALTGTYSGNPWSFIPDTSADFKYIKDTTGAFATSVNSADKIIWLSGLKPDNGTQVLITYTYNKEVQTLQNFMNEDQNKVVGASVLIKTGFIANLNLTMQVVLFPTADPVSARAKVTNAVTQYLNTFVFGQALEMSDLLVVAQTGQGTDFVITEVNYIVFDPTLIQGGITVNCYASVPDLNQNINMINDTLTVPNNQYLRPFSITIN